MEKKSQTRLFNNSTMKKKTRQRAKVSHRSQSCRHRHKVFRQQLTNSGNQISSQRRFGFFEFANFFYWGQSRDVFFANEPPGCKADELKTIRQVCTESLYEVTFFFHEIFLLFLKRFNCFLTARSSKAVLGIAFVVCHFVCSSLKIKAFCHVTYPNY